MYEKSLNYLVLRTRQVCDSCLILTSIACCLQCYYNNNNNNNHFHNFNLFHLTSILNFFKKLIKIDNFFILIFLMIFFFIYFIYIWFKIIKFKKIIFFFKIKIKSIKLYDIFTKFIKLKRLRTLNINNNIVHPNLFTCPSKCS